MQIFNQCAELDGVEDVSVSFVLLNDGELAEHLREIGVSVRILDETAMSFWDIYRALVVHCKDMEPDIIHSHRRKENVLTALVGLRLGVPSIRTVHGAPELEFSWFFAK